MLNKSVMAAVFAAMSLTACATHGQGVPMGQMQPQQYAQQRCSAPEFSLAESRNSSQSWTGELLDVRDIVIVKPHSNTGAQVVGGVTGGAIGAALGNQVGKGNGKKLATMLGGTFGAATGASVGADMAEREARVPGVMLRVRVADGRVFTYQQLANSCEPFARGMPVIITQLPGGYHVTPM